MSPSYPHRYNDCGECQRYDADLRVELDADTDAARWCEHCAGKLLKALTRAGMVATVRSVPRPAEPAAETVETPAVVHDPGWTVDLAIEALTTAVPGASALVRALVDEGGSATAVRLKELLKVEQLSPITRSLNTAARNIWRGEGLTIRVYVAMPQRDPDQPSKDVVHSYELADGTTEIWKRALLAVAVSV